MIVSTRLWHYVRKGYADTFVIGVKLM